MSDYPVLVPEEQNDPARGLGWLVISVPGKTSHVIPMNDDRPHECSDSCWCEPAEDDEDDLLVHNAMDRRELVERGEAKEN